MVIAVRRTTAKVGPCVQSQRPLFESSVTIAAKLYREALDVGANASLRAAVHKQITDHGDTVCAVDQQYRP